jgi:hypothetical protein
VTKTEAKLRARVRYLSRHVREYQRLIAEYPSAKNIQYWRAHLSDYLARLALAKKILAKKKITGEQYERMNRDISVISARRELRIAFREALAEALKKLHNGEMTPKEARSLAKSINYKRQAWEWAAPRLSTAPRNQSRKSVGSVNPPGSDDAR